MTVEATSSAGATATFTSSAADIVDGALAATCLPASGSTFAIGTTTVTCSATDAHSNTGSASFTVTVQDTTDPVVTVPANMTAEATSSAGGPAVFTSSAMDIVDGALTTTCLPASGSIFAVGPTTVTCSAKDAHGNIGSNSFTVTVQDKSAPVVTVPANITKEATSSSGAAATFSASAFDIVDGSLPVSCDHLSGGIFPIGTTTVTCSATDAHSNTSSASFTITVKDTTPPVIIIPANITTREVIVNFTTSAMDIVDGSLTSTCSPASGSKFGAGSTTTVTCSATDSAGNKGSASFVIQVEDAGNGNNANNGAFNLFGLTQFLIPVTGGQATELSCAKPSTTLEMGGFQVVFSNLCGYSAVLTKAPEGSLLGTLPNGKKYVGGLNIGLLHLGIPVNKLPENANVTIMFDVPSGMNGATLSILFWDLTANNGAGAWVEKAVTLDRGNLVLPVYSLGTFVLVDKSTP
jgi:hypothetical protein